MAAAACLWRRAATITRCVSSRLSGTERWEKLGSSGFDSTVAEQAVMSPALSPAVRYLVDSNSIDPTKIVGTGPRNRLLKGDVLRYLQDAKSSTTATAAGVVQPQSTPSLNEDATPTEPYPPLYTDIPLSAMRKAIAKRMTQSKSTSPYCYASIDCVMDNMLTIRKQQMREENLRYTVNDVIIKAAALALQRIPEFNSYLSEAGEIQRHSSVDVSVAVAMNGGLITPIIKNADQLTVPQISAKMKELADRARLGKLTPQEYQGGSFSLSNLGGHGIKEFSAIINPPQCAILAVGSMEAVPVPAELNEGRAVARVMTVTLSCDVRVIDYELTCQWLDTFKTILQHPATQGLL